MKWLKRILAGLLSLMLLIVLVSFLLPKKCHVQRQISVAAGPSAVFAMVNDLNTYDKWMPWNQKDPNMKKIFGPTTAGKGAYYSWDSKNPEVGVGKLTITESLPDSVATALDFGEMGISYGGWTLAPEGNGTKVTWFMDSDMSGGGFLYGVMGKWMGALGVFDGMVGPDFEKGLANLKLLAETASIAPPVPVGADSLVMPVK
jgi:hypothetical protein